MGFQGEVLAGEMRLPNGETSSIISVAVGWHIGSLGSEMRPIPSSESLQAIGGSEDLSSRGTFTLVSNMTPTVMVGATVLRSCLQSLDDTK